MANETNFVIQIADTPEFLRERFTSEGNDVLAFTVQYETQVEGDEKHRPVVRFDSQHERPHRDVLDWDGETVRKDWDWAGSGLSLNEALNRAIDEVIESWPRYRAEFLRRKSR